MASIKDVAKRAGVATSTVSKVLNNYPNVSDETKRKVNAAISELGFVPNAVAAALSSKQSGRVAIIVNQTGSKAINEVDIQYLSGAITKAREIGLDVVTLFDSMIKDKTLEELITYLKSQNVEGIVIFGISKENKLINSLISKKIFKVAVIDAPLVNADTSSVWVNQELAQYDVVTELLKQNGAKKILYLSGKANSYVMDGRLKGIRRICKERKIRLSIRCAEFSELEARNIIFKEGSKYDMIVCASDLMAIGAMRALTELDIFRPVCGFDGITLMGYAGKRMTTVRQNFVEIAATAMEEVSRLLSGEEGREVILSHEVVKIDYLDVIC